MLIKKKKEVTIKKKKKWTIYRESLC